MFCRRTLAAAATLTALIGFSLAVTGCEKADKPTTPAPEGTGPSEAAPYTIEVPLGLDPVPVPADNPMTAAKVELGKRLYFDASLSKDGTISCATCHDPKKAWAEELPTSKGIHGQLGERNAPTVINTAYLKVQFWDGRAADLEEQALGPIENPLEMGHAMVDVVGHLQKDPEYIRQFKDVFGTGVTKEGVAKAIAAFERTVLSGNSPYDKYTKKNDDKALNEAQKRGIEVFEGKGMCSTCHAPPVFSNSQYYNAGVGAGSDKPDEGRKKVTGKDSDLGKFRVPALREVAKTAPYFHNGSGKTLKGAVTLMAKGGIDNPNLSATMKAIREAGLSDQDIDDLVAFLEALSGEYPIVEPPK